MSDLPPDLSSALDAAAKLPRLLVTSDFDGTLSPIVSNPSDARPLPEAGRALIGLAELPSTAVALISGRALRDLRALSSMPDAVHLVGSHGAEFDSGFSHDINQELLRSITETLEEIALTDDFFIERKLYPNVDYYTGVIYRAMGFPTRMFTVLFALGRLPGWIAHWREMHGEPNKIGRPRQIYTGYTERPYVPLDSR